MSSKNVLKLTLAGLLSALLLAGSATAVVVPQRGIAGVQLGMTKAAVRGQLGKPRKIEQGSNEIGPFTTFRYPTLSITFFGGPRVTSVTTTSPTERTSRGVGVGSRTSEVLAKVAKVRCVTESGFRHCFVGSFVPGKRVTDFTIKNGKVARITVGFVID